MKVSNRVVREAKCPLPTCCLTCLDGLVRILIPKIALKLRLRVDDFDRFCLRVDGLSI